MLQEMLAAHPIWDTLNLEQQALFTRLAQVFESSDTHLTLNAEELAKTTGIGHRHQWWDFLDLEPVDNYIHRQNERLTKVATRKVLSELQRELQTGNVGAAKEINQIAGILEKSDSNRVIIMHHIPRPTQRPNDPTTIRR